MEEDWRTGAMATLNVKNLPDSLYRKLQARAKRQRRSVAQEVTQILSEALEAPKQCQYWNFAVWARTTGRTWMPQRTLRASARRGTDPRARRVRVIRERAA
jgi:plasmid stability protein